MKNSKLKDYSKLLEYSLKLSARKRYTISRLEEKLSKFTEATLETKQQVINRLIDLKYLNDEQFVMDYIAERSKINPKGRFVLKLELYKKGIPKELIDNVMGGLDIDERALAMKALSLRQRKWNSIPKEKYRDKAFSFLRSRGFSIDAIYNTVDYYYSNSIDKDLT